MDNKVKNKLEEMYDKEIWKHITLGDALTNWSNTYKDKIAVVDGDKRISYEKLNSEAESYAEGFLKIGFKKGDKVVIQLPNCLEFIIISFALFKIGVIPIMALPAHRKIELKGIIEKSQAKGYIAREKYLGFSYKEMIGDILEDLNIDIKIFILGQNKEFNNFLSLNSQSELNQKTEVDYKEVGLLLLSGGTTGIPKLIPRRHCDYLYVAEYASKRCEINQNSVYLAALPMAHNFPLDCPGIIGTLMCGGKVVICPTTSPDEIIPLIQDEGVTITGLVPAMANMCIEFLQMEDEYDISSLKVVQIGGSVLDSSLAKKIHKSFKCKLQQIFGIAEGLICCTSLNDDEYIVYNTQGKPISNYDEILIVNENGEEVAIGEYGELIVRGPYTIYGYYNSDEVNRICISEQCYFRTGDKARKLKDGNYQIVGRLKEIINRAGEKIMPSELEQILLQHPSIDDVQVLGLPDKILGEKIGVFILGDKKLLNLNDLRIFLLEKGVAQFKLPDQITYIDSWPLTSVGKINKNILKDIVIS